MPLILHLINLRRNRTFLDTCPFISIQHIHSLLGQHSLLVIGSASIASFLNLSLPPVQSHCLELHCPTTITTTSAVGRPYNPLSASIILRQLSSLPSLVHQQQAFNFFAFGQALQWQLNNHSQQSGSATNVMRLLTCVLTRLAAQTCSQRLARRALMTCAKTARQTTLSQVPWAHLYELDQHRQQGCLRLPFHQWHRACEITVVKAGSCDASRVANTPFD